MEALTVSRAEAGQKLLNFLERRVEASPAELHRWVRTGQVRVNGGRAKPFGRVEEGDAVRVPPFAVLREVETLGDQGASKESGGPAGKKGAGRAESVSPASGLGISVVYEDTDVLVLDKPAGLPAQDGTGHSDSVASRLAAHYARADFVPAPAHRLDRDTSGLLVAGKSYAALRVLTDALAGRSGQSIEQGALIKEYLTWVRGDWPFADTRELRDMLAKDEATGRVGSRAEEAGGREARCLATPLAAASWQGEPVTLLLVRLLTGRTHQIRAQLALRGHPVIGDARYDERQPRFTGGRKAEGLKLHACRLVLPDGREFRSLPPWSSQWRVSVLPELTQA